MKPEKQLNKWARDLRNNSTDAERALWHHISKLEIIFCAFWQENNFVNALIQFIWARNSQVEGVKFRRQEPIEGYIADFVSFSPKLIIELDGGQHSENQTYDEKRDVCLKNNGFDVLRFWNNDVFENIDGVLEVIRQRCLKVTSPTPPPPPARGGGAKSCDAGNHNV